MLAELYADLVALTPRGLPLPAVIFFRPKPKFVEWMRCTVGAGLVYDVGAGCGQVSRALSDAGLAVKAIDTTLRVRGEFRVHQADGASFPYEEDSTAMLCRPCHGLFTQAVIERAIERGARRVLYVGLPRNVKLDLGSYAGRFRRVLTGAGEDGENVYQLRVD
ncbi:MAG TPA: class I SAM-dependent methyltransferase [Pyrinomonadaceae bacterium]